MPNAGSSLSHAYQVGLSGLPCPDRYSIKTSVTNEAWKNGHKEHIKITKHQLKILKLLLNGSRMTASASIGLGLISIDRQRISITTAISLESKGLICKSKRSQKFGEYKTWYWEWNLTKKGILAANVRT